MARASRKNRPGYATKGSRVRRNAKREAARGAAGEWEGAADEWEGAGEHAAQTMEQGASGDFASGEPSPPPPTPSSPSPVDLGEVCMDLRGQLLEEKEAEVEAKKRQGVA